MTRLFLVPLLLALLWLIVLLWLRVPLRQGAKGFLAESWHSLLDMAGYGKTAPYGYKPQGAPEAPKPATR